ncbi:hypothetical protein [Vibrio hippocampi]|uniref:Uncharacterized protein n=1 Tax=Vibrio hippocampi TaxID=654686 RepID=A0ABM8ZLW8_9VIBR|nr:hypothetical protein [Vibrio hippocampi]CAH0527343.1 hypothetical protein VHP8226_02661 [Vibrio hippocampi]
MKKLGLAALSAAMVASFSASASTTSATASWQGVISGIVAGETIMITGRDGAEVVPIGQLMRNTSGSLVGPDIQLEAWTNTGTAATPVPGELIEVGTTINDDIAGGATAYSGLEWQVTDIATFVEGAPVNGIGWTVNNGNTEIAAFDGMGALTSGTLATDNIIKVNVASSDDTATKNVIDSHSGKDAAVSVTIVLTGS